jgi:formylglycine-generating enzyme required for sulfatase activity
VIESRDLFVSHDTLALATAAAAEYEARGHEWPLADRLLLLDLLGRLDPGGDPRVRPERWIRVGRGAGFRAKVGRDQVAVPAFSMAWAPTTCQELVSLVDADDAADPALWPSSRTPAHERVAGLRHLRGAMLARPNYPATHVDWHAATAYCRWRTRRRDDGLVVRLPTALERIIAARSAGGADYPWGKEPVGDSAATARANWRGLVDHRPGLAPVGAFPGGSIGGFVDLAGNVYEWCDSDANGKATMTVMGGCWRSPEEELRTTWRGAARADRHWSNVGFRCVLAAGATATVAGPGGP